ncbi:MAG: hypothetical protein Tsb002_22120 [Wenzhouxiangellaceae bacterium]
MAPAAPASPRNSQTFNEYMDTSSACGLAAGDSTYCPGKPYTQLMTLRLQPPNRVQWLFDRAKHYNIQ